MKNIDVIRNFLVCSKAESSTGSLKSTGDKLFSYFTCIAQHYNDKILFNAVKYSSTTSTHQGILKRETNTELIPVYKVFNNFTGKYSQIPRGQQDLMQCSS